MSSRVYAIIPAGAGVTRSARSARFADTWSSQAIGCTIRPRMSRGTESTVAKRSARCSATAFGTSSPRMTDRYVRIAKAITKAMPADSGGSKKSESRGSPTAPMRMANTVMPSWITPMNRTGSSMRLSALFAPRLPRAARSSRRARRAVINEYSAATKSALPSTSMSTIRRSRKTVTTLALAPFASAPRGVCALPP
jgi:hypothetical protein